jgi:hypothetical protein
MYDEKFDKKFETNRKLYETAIRQHVCERCVDFGEDSVCHKAGGTEACAVIRNLKEIVYIAKQVHSKKIDPYVQALREKVCSHCANSQKDGSCKAREEIECCIDRYLPLVLEAIEGI